jgi:hypothetical protein
VFAQPRMLIRAASPLLEPMNSTSASVSHKLRKSRFYYSVIGLLLLLIFVEFGLRLVLGLGHPILYELDPSFGYFTQPHQYTRRLFARTSTNSLGMRSPEFTIEKPAGALRLMFLGDSITFGTTQVDQGSIFAEEVRKDLSIMLHRQVEEINASANGWAISNEDGFLHSRGTYNSDDVVLVLNSGDLDQPFSRFSDVAGGQTNSPRTAIGELITRLMMLRNRFSHQDAGTTVENDPATERKNLQELTSMAEFSRGHGSGFLLVFVPFRREIVDGAASSIPGPLKDWAASENINYLDLTSAVSGYETQAITLRDGTHYNARGNRLLADSLENYLADRFGK